MKFFSSRKQKNERGVTLVVFAISLTALIGMLGVALDGSVAFGSRRQMQNSADTAALAGAHAFNEYLMNPETADASKVWASVQTNATTNQADDVECVWVHDGDPNLPGAELGDCANIAYAPMASGVKVTTRLTTDTTFAQIFGQDAYTAEASAVAQVQRIAQLGQPSPFLVCAVDRNELGGEDMLARDSQGRWAVNPDAFGTAYQLHHPQSSQINDCGIGELTGSSNFSGLADNDTNEISSVPGWWTAEPGNVTGPTEQDLGSIPGCNTSNGNYGETRSCFIILPLCVRARGTSLNNNANDTNRSEMDCVAYGTFEVRKGTAPGIQSVGNNAHYGILSDISVVLPVGAGGGVPQGQHEPRVIRLTE